MTKYVKGALFGVAALALLIVGAGTALVGQRLYRNYTGLKANNAVLNQQLAEYAALIENQKVAIAQLSSAAPVLSRLNVRQLAIDHDSILRAFDRDGFPDTALESFDKFHEYVSGLYVAAEPAIAERWGLQSRKLRRVLFFAATVGTLFEYGNRTKRDLPGCSYWSERTGHAKVTVALSQKQFLNAIIGCCDDYAIMMGAILRREKIENRRLAGSGHTWNEFDLDGQTYLIDANVGLLTASSWADLADAKQVSVWQIPLAGAMPTAGDRYRPSLGFFAAYMLNKMAAGGFPVNIANDGPELALEQVSQEQ
jgi:negative regulator of replication initiation